MANQRFLKETTQWLPKRMSINISIFFTVLNLSLLISGCATSTTFRVVNVETKEPIEGAVALAMWDDTRGLPGLTSTYTAKAVEAVSDANGKFTIPVLFGSAAISKPHLKVYKPGYVGWDSKLIYLGCRENDSKRAVTKRRENFSMKDQDIFLEPWKDEYTFISHGMFIDVPGDIYKAGIEDSKYNQAIRFEGPRRERERRIMSQ